MLYFICFAILGYLLGGILFAPIFGKIFKKDVVGSSDDKNPGAANAFKNGGPLCGVLTLACDVLKGLVPVAICLCNNKCDDLLTNQIGTALVLLAPVLGHMFPVYRHFKGGKGIAVTFGVLLGYLPYIYPALILAIFFILFSVVIVVKPDFYKTLLVYFCVSVTFLIKSPFPGLRLGFILISIFVFLRFHLSKEKREKIEVKFLWKH